MLSAGPESRAPSQLASATAPAPPAASAAATPQRVIPPCDRSCMPIFPQRPLWRSLATIIHGDASPLAILRHARDGPRASVTIVAPKPIHGKKLIRAWALTGHRLRRMLGMPA